jgi:glucose-1-phosphate thymidylyltransferase
MIYYPLSVLMLAGIRDILLITTPEDVRSFERLLEDGSELGIRIRYAVQPRPEGLAQAFIIGREFVAQDRVALILGDNIFYGHGFQEMLQRSAARHEGATVYAYEVRDPQRYGVIELDSAGRPISIVEKPADPRTNLAVTGLYFYDNEVLDIAAGLKPSPRGELEITDVNNVYLQRRRLHVERLGRGFAWLDTGTERSLMLASDFVQTIEDRQGLKIACIDADRLRSRADSFRNAYGDYLRELVAGNSRSSN